MIVDDDAPVSRAGAIWNHFKWIYSTRRRQREPSSRLAALRKMIARRQQKSAGLTPRFS
jgi:hypothetical protein